MTTLIIHPEDDTTTFLNRVYKNIPNKTVLSKNFTNKDIYDAIVEHDRVMMMGHGSPGGLFNTDSFNYQMNSSYFLINHKHSNILNQKKDNVFIWCNADKFVEYYGLKGFYTGMFISEMGEASYCGLKNYTKEQLDESNYSFVDIFGRYANLPTDQLYENVHREYGKLIENNPIANYNHQRLYKN